MSCKEKLHLFFGSTSIRGFSRIARSPDKFVRYLWIVFVISTTILLISSVIKVIGIYLQYSVNIQTFQKLDDPSPFPAVTVCNHQAFSEHAYQLWREGKVMSPTEFNRKMRASALRNLDQSVLNNTTDFVADLFFSIGVAWDKISVYYQNLDPEDALHLGHTKSMLHNCMWMKGRDLSFDDNCADDMWIVKNYSHHAYFNCITIEPHPEYQTQVTQLGLIIWLGPPENYDIQYRQGFLFDIYQQAFGLRVVIHEPDHIPNVDVEGVQIEPGKMNEINYQATRFTRVNSAKHPCLHDSQKRFKDLNNSYAYDPELCLNAGLQESILNACHCLYGYFPRIQQPSLSTPYCGKIDLDKLDEFLTRATCVKKFLNDKGKIKAELEASTCQRRCTEIGYENTVSVTRWRPTNWQLHWLPRIYAMFQSFRKSADPEVREENFQSLREYFKLHNITILPKGEAENLAFDDHHTFLVVKRKGNSTQVKEERLVLTINALFSQIGGLCSLCIGLTLAFLVEVIEFLYTICFKSPQPSPDRNVAPCDTSPKCANDHLRDCSHTTLLRESTPSQPSPMSHFPDPNDGVWTHKLDDKKYNNHRPSDFVSSPDMEETV